MSPEKVKIMKILGIETSCDDTAAAVVEAQILPAGRQGEFGSPSFSVLSNVSYSQVAIHKKFGGIVPNLASRAHLQKIAPMVKAALSISKTNRDKIDLIAVTRGPGLMPSLLVGVNFARALAYKWKKPVIEVNHIEGHIYSNWLSSQDSSRHLMRLNNKIELPALILIVSGGHTELALMKGYGKYKIIGETLDDAAGECFDKTARILGLGFPGGPAIARLAEQWQEGLPKGKKIQLPRPMINSKNYNFSFSGLKTAVLYLYNDLIQNMEPSNYDVAIHRNNKCRDSAEVKKIKSAIANEIQQAIIDVLTAKTLKAIKNFRPKAVMIAGGVSANKKLRNEMALKIVPYKIPFFAPELKYTTDNAAMIAVTGYFSYLNKKPVHDSWKKIAADANLKIS